MVHPVKKRGRPAEDIWPDGSITKIVFENFLTYGHHVECMPGPNLNVIIGSNGTGKSTIICAICLAMGGSPKLLGRSERFSDYIKHGQDSGSVEITMSDSKKSTPPVIRLEIRRPNSTQYFIDGRKVTLKQLREFVDTYNIQIENPCTFLAQDKVKSFSEQNPQLLLENTERAGRPDLLEMHEELKKNRNGGKDLEASCADLERRIAAIRASMTVLEPRVKNFNEREKMHEKVALLEKKESLLVYEEMRKLYDERKKELSKVQQEIAQARAFLQPLQKEIEELKKKVADRIEVLRKLRHTKSGSVQEIDNLKTRLERCEQEVERVRLQYQRSVEEAQQYDSRISNTQQEIRVVEEQLEACSHSNAVDLRPEIKRLQVEYDKLDKKEEEIDQKQEGLQRDERQLKQRFNDIYREKMKIQQAEEDKLSLLERNTRGVGAADAWRWYSSNREKFLRPVYVPLLCMSLKESTDARYLENIVGNRDFQMFVCGCPQDEALLQKQAHDSRWRINSTVLQMPETSEDDNGRRLPQNLAALGFRCFASQLFDAPSIVKKYLCNVAVLDRIPIGTNQTDQLLERSGDDKLMEEFARQGLKLLLTTSKRMSIVQSRYSNGCSTRVDELRDQIRWLTMHTMTSSTVDLAGKNDECKELQTRLDAKKADCAGQKTEIGRERERIRQQLRELSQRQDTKNRLQRDLETKNARLKQMMENKPDLNQATVDMETALKDLTRRSLTSIQHMADTLARIEELTHRMGSAALEHEFFKRLLAKKQLELSNHQDVGQQKLDEFTEKKREVDEVKQRVRSQLMKVYERTGLSSLNRDALPPAEVATYDAMWKTFNDAKISNDLASVKLQLAQESGRLNAAGTDGQKQDLVEYHKLQEELVMKTTTLQSEMRKRDNWQQQMDERRTEWLTPLTQLIQSISDNFANFFTQIGCSGEVRLSKGDDPNDVSKYGVEIMVKFRANEKLRRLTAQVQSGGERSVSTMLYMMALQELCPVPFRCVDEINQGMDPTNERKVFGMMVNLLSGTGNLSKTQYFMLTPKLLPNLKFSNKLSVLIVHNGPAMLEENKWNMEKFIELATAA